MAVKALFFMVLGAVALVVAALLAARTAEFVRSAARAEGEVVRLNAGGSHPEVAFTTTTGERVSYPQGGFIAGYAVGDRVRVLYDAAAPAATARIDAVGSLWAWPLIVGFLGSAFVLLGWLNRAGA